MVPIDDFFQVLQKKWSIRYLGEKSLYDLQCFVDLFENFFEQCEGAKGSALGILKACPVTKDRLRDKFLIGLYQNDLLIGLIDLIQNYPHDEVWMIGYFLIHPQFRNKDLGSRFIADVEQSLKRYGVKRLRCVVQRQNPKAYSFWRKNNFSLQNEIVENRNGQDQFSYIMEKNL